MIIVIAKAEVIEGAEARFAKAALACVAKTREEEGNISYTLLQDAEQPGSFTFLEEWTSQQALDEHMETEHFLAFGAASEGLLAEELTVDVYDASKLD